MTHPVVHSAPSGAKASRLWRLSLVLAACSWLYGCGGGAVSEGDSVRSQEVIASGETTLELAGTALQDAANPQVVSPTFHLAPVLLAEPEAVDSTKAAIAAQQPPEVHLVPPDLAELSTRRLTVDAMQTARAFGVKSVVQEAGGGTMRAGTAVTTYAPAQVRAAYGFPSISGTPASLTAAQAAQWGAGQTIYVIAAKHNPYVASELAAFNQKFGLPTCTSKVLPANTVLPVAPASAAARSCELWVAYSAAAGGLTGTAPAYDSGWATEIALDVQWAHAMAPLARIVLVEAPDASVNSLLSAIRVANSMGPGVVSMSFGAGEGSWTASVDAAFTGANMSYLAATGDSGAAVSWPAVSPNVLGVGGTTLTYTGTGARSEVAWSGTGGGTSAYVATPAYQKSGMPVVGSVVRRTVADVAMNADPASGQYVAVTSASTGAIQWVSAGGTSLSTPLWAGLLATANAMRADVAKAPLGLAQTPLYAQVGAVSGNYAAGFLDITAGTHGTCGTCSARAGYDQLTGLGTPQASALLGMLTGTAAVASAPVVTGATITGEAAKALSFTAAVTATNPVTWTLSGAPAGMAINASGVVSWAAPMAGTYSVTVTAKDSVTGKTGQGTYTVNILAAKAPVIAGATITGQPGVALSFNVATTSSNPVTYALAGAPTGMAISSAGVVSWSSPVAGTYSITVTARDSVNGLSGSAVFSVKISATSTGIAITAQPMVGIAGKPLSGVIGLSAPGASAISVTISGVPLGMGLSMQGTNVIVNWPSPVTGKYSLQVTLRDSLGRMTQATVPVTITAY